MKRSGGAASVRTTLTLDADVVQLIEDAVHRDRTSMKGVVNEALRRGLQRPGRAPETPYRVQVHHATVAPGLDPTGFNRLADELENEAIVSRLSMTT